ncbi:uncharacterized protein LOC108479837 [Gossypium arboreum]|uniref:uncharacterized protein LOC108479837 n=1 Tax=Gossypium arboreum TaxID=29729 RepID=UPI0008193605|nr:uncharacterized protein LOC108479837 [Gossypium arboreum]XP_017638142.1 uncharacterized protein LOC108479837 [Gossypium arboreum]XP_052879428.1 uncharacterized protein LOC108479837 [Gossypium arboreum]
MATKKSVGDLKEADLKGKKVFVRVICSSSASKGILRRSSPILLIFLLTRSLATTLLEARAESTDGLRPIFFTINVAVYSIQVTDQGILCIGFLKRSRQQKEITRDQAVQDLEELERRGEEFEQLLLAERV